MFRQETGINSDRGDFPYTEINDHATQRWYYLANEMATKPTSNIELYNEFISGIFEPRESERRYGKSAFLFLDDILMIFKVGI